MLRSRVSTTLAALSLALVPFAATGNAAAAGASGVVSSEAISTLLGGTPAPTQIREGQRSPDGSRILYRVLEAGTAVPGGGESATEHDGAYWSVRADGTQATQLSLEGDDNVWVQGGYWRLDGLVGYRVETANGDDLLTHQKVIASGGNDEWIEAAPGEGGEATPDGRFRWMDFTDLVLDNADGGPTVAYEVATGEVHVMVWAAPNAGGYVWRNDCGDNQRNMQGTLPGALVGPKPACRFARLAGDGNAPGDGDWATAATVATATGLNAASIFSARYSPDRSRIVFRVATDPLLDDPASDPLEGDFWVVRADGTQLRRLTTSTGTTFTAIRARWISNAQIEVQYGGPASSTHLQDTLTTSGATDCWNTTFPNQVTEWTPATKITSTECDAGPVDPEPTTPQQPAPPQQGAPQQGQSQPITLPKGITPAKVLAVGTKLGGKKKNLLTVKFVSPEGYGARVTLALRDGGKVIATVDLSVAQAKTGVTRLKLSAKSRKLLKASKGRVTVRVVPLSAS